MLLELEKRRGPRALLLRRPPRAELTPMRLFLPDTNGEFSTEDPRSKTSDRGLSQTRTWVEPTSLHAAAPISMRCLLTLAATNRSHLLTPTVVPLLLLPPVTPSRPPRTRSTGEQVSETTPLLVPIRGEGRIGFWAAITRLLASDRLLPLRPRRLRHHHVHRRRPCRRRGRR